MFLTIVFSVIWKLFDTIFLGGLQAFIFALLTVLYFGMAGATVTTSTSDDQHEQGRPGRQQADADRAPAEPEPAH